MDSLQACLINSYNPNNQLRLEAEEALTRFLLIPNSCLQLLTLVGQADVHREIRLAACILVKNRITHFWTSSDGFVIDEPNRELFKQYIVDCLLYEQDNALKGWYIYPLSQDDTVIFVS
jgi:hypothetical protein